MRRRNQLEVVTMKEIARSRVGASNILQDGRAAKRTRRRLYVRRRRLALEVLEGRALLASDIALVKDINTEPNAGYMVPSGDGQPAVLGNETYFSTYVDGYGEELWKTDGTDAGTKLVKDIVPGVGSSEPSGLTVVGNELLFTVSLIYSGATQLWKTDGTEAGTVLVKDFGPGAYNKYIGDIFAADQGVYFTYQPSNDDYMELWYSNGTTAGTYVVADQSFALNYIYLGVESGGAFFFTGSNNDQGSELWRSNGTPEGTYLIKDIVPGIFSSQPFGLTPYQDGIIFSINYGTTDAGAELWKSDGTSDGTVQVIDIQPGSEGSQPMNLTAAGNVVIFSAFTVQFGRELWMTDGTKDGTMMIGDLNPGPDSSTPNDFTAVGTSALYFLARGHAVGEELWILDVDGPRFVKDIYPGDGSSNLDELVGVGNLLYFVANDGVHGKELWRSNGTDAGTWMVEDEASAYSSPNRLTPISGVLFFTRYDFGTYSEVLRFYDGVSPTSNKVVFSWAANSSSNPHSYTNVNGVVFFSAYDSTHGVELWKSEGPDTVLVKDLITTNNEGSHPEFLVNLNGILYFTASTGSGGRQIWKSNGTPDGTTLAFDSDLSSQLGDVDQILVSNGKLFIVCPRPNDKFDLWISDGTNANTRLLKTYSGFAWYSEPLITDIIAYEGAYYFAANDGIHGEELWKTDGTPEGTFIVHEVGAGVKSSYPSNLTTLNGKLYFKAYSGVYDIELWRTDGSESGTELVYGFAYPPQGNSYGYSLSEIVVANGNLYFLGYELDTGAELWKSDGTTAGTVIVADSIPGPGGTIPQFLMSDGTHVFYAGDTPEHGWEPWVSDGSAVNTKMVVDIWPGPTGGINVDNGYYYYYEGEAAIVANGKVYFTANDGVHGEEPWVSDGTLAGTQMIKDIIPGSGASAPYGFTQIGDMLFMSANHSIYGNEPFAMSLTASAPVAADDSAVTQAGFTFAISVLANDSATEGQLVPGSVTLVANPTLGSATANTDGTITFVPPAAGNGSTTLTYRVKNDSELWSNIATVTVKWQQSIFQNPGVKYDVDKDKNVSPLDVLVLIDEINRNGTRPLPPQSGIPNRYWDVNADRSLDPLDVLEVINFYNRGSLGGEGESASNDSMLDSIWSQMGVGLDDDLFGSGNGKKKRDRVSG